MKSDVFRPFGWWFSQWRKGADNTELRFSETEQMFFDGFRGFVCFDFTPDGKLMHITKMCGDVAHWRPILVDTFQAAQRMYGTEAIVCHATRRAEAYKRLMNGDVFRVTKTKDGGDKYWIITFNPIRRGG
ncbi:MAG: hypothetical protein Q4C86_14620 [bacterium]|nr:hypothetical protein [bacterium]